MPNNRPTALPDIRHTVVINAPIRKVWQAVSTSEGMAEWFMPNSFQPKIGHEFSLHTPFGISSCKVTEIDPPYRLAFTWGEHWHVSFELKELDESTTELTLVHSGWDAAVTAKETGENHAAVRDKMDQGWGSVVLKRLRQAVES